MAAKKRRRRLFKDRKDGYLIKPRDPLFKLIPHIMKKRSDAQVFFEDTIDITATDRYIKEKRAQGHKNLKLLDVFIASYVRTISQYPEVNRFVTGRKIYARSSIATAIAIKKEMTRTAPETPVKVEYDPEATLFEVSEKLHDAITESRSEDNDAVNFVKALYYIPNFIIRMLVWFLERLDGLGILPKAFRDMSPFHTGLFITDLGSLGINPVYHHIYDFGNTTIFVAFGYKRVGRDGIKRIAVRVVADERICDGFALASAIRMFFKFLQKPHLLEEPPKEIFEDDEI